MESDESDAADDYRRDEGYSWVILACVFVVAFFHLGIIKVFGVFIPVLVKELDLNMWAVGFSVSMGIAGNSLLGTLFDKRVNRVFVCLFVCFFVCLVFFFFFGFFKRVNQKN